MSVSDEWRSITYQETFEEEIRGLSRRRQSDPALTAEDLEASLKNLYIMDGGDNGGRGCLQDTIIAAQIAALEQFIAEWKAVNPTKLPAG